jgi:hypothetical protein
VLTVANEQFGYRASGPNGESVVVLLNISDEAHRFEVEDVRAVEVLLSSAEGSLEFTGMLDAHGWVVGQPV